MFVKRADEEEDVPSWLKQDYAPSSEKTSLMPTAMPKSTSYGGQSNASSPSYVEEDYGSYSRNIGGGSEEDIDTSWVHGVQQNDDMKVENYVAEDSDVEKIYSTEDDDDDESDEDDVAEKDVKDDISGPFTREKNDLSTEKKYKSKKKKSRKENSDTSSSKKRKTRNKKSDRKVPRRTACHSIFVVLQIVAVLANLSMIATQIVPIIICDLDVLQSIVRSYLSFFSLFFLISELELLKASGLNNWISRGFLYTFLGVVAMEQKVAMLSDGALDTIAQKERFVDVRWTVLFIEVSSWWMVSIGCLYFLFGLCFMQRVRDKCRESYQERKKKYEEGLKKAKTKARKKEEEKWEA